MIVIDASMAGALVLPDEPDPPVVVRERLFTGPLIAPGHWPTEIGNALLMAERRGRFGADARRALFGKLGGLQVDVIAADSPSLWSDVLALAHRHRLTLYDAAYLALAIDRRAALASDDRELIAAARASGVEILTSLP